MKKAIVILAAMAILFVSGTAAVAGDSANVAVSATVVGTCKFNNGGTIILQTSGTEKVYDPKLAKTVNPFLAYTPNGIVTSVRKIVNDLDRSNERFVLIIDKALFC